MTSSHLPPSFHVWWSWEMMVSAHQVTNHVLHSNSIQVDMWAWSHDVLRFLWIFWSPFDLAALTSEKAFCKYLVLGFVWHVYSGVPWFFCDFCESFEACHTPSCHTPLQTHTSKKCCQMMPILPMIYKQTQTFSTLFFKHFLHFYWTFIGIL